MGSHGEIGATVSVHWGYGRDRIWWPSPPQTSSSDTGLHGADAEIIPANPTTDAPARCARAGSRARVSPRRPPMRGATPRRARLHSVSCLRLYRRVSPERPSDIKAIDEGGHGPHRGTCPPHPRPRHAGQCPHWARPWWRLAISGDCQVMAPLVATRWLVVSGIQAGCRVCHPLLACGDGAAATLNHQHWTRARVLGRALCETDWL